MPTTQSTNGLVLRGAGDHPDVDLGLDASLEVVVACHARILVSQQEPPHRAALHANLGTPGDTQEGEALAAAVLVALDLHITFVVWPGS